MLRLCLAILFGAVIASCKKDDLVSVSYPSAYYKTGLERNGDFKVFTSAGEIRDRSIINRFKDRDTGYFSYVFNDIAYRDEVMDTINFSNEDRVSVRHNFREIKCVVTQAGQNLILTGRDTITGYSGIDPLTENISYRMQQIKPEVFTEYVYSSVQGYYLFGFTGREKFVLRGSGDKLMAPIIQFFRHSARFNSNGYVNNLLQPDFYKHITTGDTVTLQQGSILYQKK